MAIKNLKMSKGKDNQPLKYIALKDKKTRYEVTLNQPYDIEIMESEDGFFYLKWKNRKYVAEILEKRQNKYTVLVNGVSYSFSVETPTSFKRKKYLEKHQEKSATEPIVAPMPGKIVEVIAEENTDVKPGDPIFILEAMKMQNEIHTEIGGKVTKINVKENDAVDKGDVLVEIESSK